MVIRDNYVKAAGGDGITAMYALRPLVYPIIDFACNGICCIAMCIRDRYRIDDEAALSCLIPRFTLQPIVENSIFHGIEPKGTPGTITVHIFRKNDAILQIDITDDGVGMTEEQARQLLSETKNAKTEFFREIGVSNVHKRLQYEFGEDYGLRVASHLSEFTTVSVLLPFTPQENIR